jgi:DNA-binding CsgD family transcriptional regulator
VNSRRKAEARVIDVLLLEELHAHLPVGLLVNDVETLEILHAHPPLPVFADPDLPLDEQAESRKENRHTRVAIPEFASRLQEVAATGSPHHLQEFSDEPPGRERRWWSATLNRIETDRWGRVVVTLAVDLTDQVRARHLLEEHERRQLALRQAIAAVSGRNRAATLPQVADAVLPAFHVDVAALRLLDADEKLHLIAASGLRPAERRRLALEPISVRQLETMIEGTRHPLVGSGDLTWVEIRWLETRDGRIGTLTIGARGERRPSVDDLGLLDAVAAQLSSALKTAERSSRFLRSRSLAMGRLGAEEEQAAEARAKDLRPRELAILRLYAEGLATEQIAELLVLSPHTVRTHVRNARRRLSVSSRAAALELLRTTDPDLII